MDYQQAKIYKIVSDECYEIYIGSTCKELSERFSKHKNAYKRWMRGNYSFVFSFPFFQICSDARIELIENYQCNNKEELHARERYYIEQNKNICINKNIPGRTDNEYYKDNKDHIKEQKNTKIECECGGKFTLANKSQHMKTITHKQYITLQQTQ